MKSVKKQNEKTFNNFIAFKITHIQDSNVSDSELENNLTILL